MLNWAFPPIYDFHIGGKMKEFEENKIKFDIDQNKQKINYLSRKNKENETGYSEYSADVSLPDPLYE